MWPDEHDPTKLPRHFFASDADLDFDGAEPANIDAQNYSVHPRYWYVDAWQACTQCSSPFLFSTDEQRYWYEERGFYVDSHPIRCKDCRRDQRRIKRARQRYGELREDAIRRDAPRGLKVEVLGLIDELDAAGEQLPDQTLRCRQVLCEQIAAAEEESA